MIETKPRINCGNRGQLFRATKRKSGKKNEKTKKKQFAGPERGFEPMIFAIPVQELPFPFPLPLSLKCIPFYESK